MSGINGGWNIYAWWFRWYRGRWYCSAFRGFGIKLLLDTHILLWAAGDVRLVWAPHKQKERDAWFRSFLALRNFPSLTQSAALSCLGYLLRVDGNRAGISNPHNSIMDLFSLSSRVICCAKLAVWWNYIFSIALILNNSCWVGESEKTRAKRCAPPGFNLDLSLIHRRGVRCCLS